jgi:pSer/pThr/pTyr-binding forkhead associated (FHA) protein
MPLVLRGERNLSLFCEGATWFLEDLGSTNGSFVQGRALARGHPFPLPHGITHVEIGKTKDRPGPVVVSLRRPAKDPGAVVISVKAAIGADAELEADAWPSMKTDINRRWVVFREQIGISAAEDVALDVDGGEQGILAALRYQSGFWIVPSSRHRLQVDGVPFHEPVPLFPGATLSLGGTTFLVDKSEASTSADASFQAQSIAR